MISYPTPQMEYAVSSTRVFGRLKDFRSISVEFTYLCGTLGRFNLDGFAIGRREGDEQIRILRSREVARLVR